jgi:outer membrane protein
LPDVLNARAEAAQASFDLQSAIGDETIAHVRLSEAIGAEPSPDIQIELPKDAALPKELILSIDELIDRAVHSRPDLQSQVAEIRAAYAATREAKSAFLPTLSISGTGGQTSEWPTADNGKLGAASISTWSASLNLRWTILDGGARKNRVQAEESREREEEARLRELHDQTVREVWSSYISFLTAVKKENSAIVLLAAANESYSASLDAYKFGVKNLIDVVTAEKQLAQARLSSVAARSELLTEAVNIEFVTGSLLRAGPPLTSPTSAGEEHK